MFKLLLLKPWRKTTFLFTNSVRAMKSIVLRITIRSEHTNISSTKTK